MEEPDDLQPIDEDEDGEAEEEEEDEAGDDEEDDEDEEDDDEEETEFATIAGAATVEEAKRTALDQLRKIVPYVNPADVEYLVVEEGSKGGLFGRGKVEAQVEARLRPSGERVDADLPPGAETLRDFVQTTVDLMGIEAHVGASETPEVVRAEISGDDLGLLIGRHGATIDALQYIAAIVVNGDRRDRRQVIVDAEGYRERRAVALSALADRTAQKVARESASIALKPMTAAERKVIHLHLKDHPRVETASEGNEPFRAVVVSPKRGAE
jgi:spoIIIJ-associated protein